MTQTWHTSNQPVQSPNGVVAAQHRLAAAAGADVLARGGNAMDAAVTAALALSVVEPWFSGIGGGGLLLHCSSRGNVDALDFNMVAPANLDPTRYPLTGDSGGDWFNWPAVAEGRNSIGYEAICVPGAIAGLSAALERFGTISFADAAAPAIELAERGLEVDWFACLTISINAKLLAQDRAAAELFLDDGQAPKPSETGTTASRRMPQKAALLRRLASSGPRDFYEGEIARRLVEDLQAGGSRIDARDLASYQPRWNSALVENYRDWAVYAVPGLTGGPMLLAALSDLERTTSPPEDRASRLVAGAAALRTRFEERLQNEGHAALVEGDCTSHISVIDRTGCAVSLTNTLLSRFGANVVLPKTGLLMNNAMMWFDPRPGHPNSIASSAQPLANMCPLIVEGPNGSRLAVGASGGRKIVPALLQLVSAIVDDGLTLEQAMNRPRIDTSESQILVNRRLPVDVQKGLELVFNIRLVDDTLYPNNFAVPSAVLWTGDFSEGMGHPGVPWSDAVASPL